MGTVFKPEEEFPEYYSLQAAMMAHARIQPRPVHQDTKGKGNYTWPKKKQDARPGNHESPPMDILMKIMYDMKAEMGALNRALPQAGICVDNAPYQTKKLEQLNKGNQKSKFTGIAKNINQCKKMDLRTPFSNQVTNSADGGRSHMHLAHALQQRAFGDPEGFPSIFVIEKIKIPIVKCIETFRGLGDSIFYARHIEFLRLRNRFERIISLTLMIIVSSILLVTCFTVLNHAYGVTLSRVIFFLCRCHSLDITRLLLSPLAKLALAAMTELLKT
jgi:hypothetical protein